MIDKYPACLQNLSAMFTSQSTLKAINPAFN